MAIRTLLLAVVMTLTGALLAAAQPNGTPFDRGSKFRQTPKLRDNSVPKLGHTKPGRYGRWARTDNTDYAGDWSNEQGWLAPPDTMTDEQFQNYLADVHSPAGDIQTGSVPPINWNGVIYVACRDYFNAVGCTAVWNEATHSAEAKLPDARGIVLPLNQGVVKIDGKPALLAHPTADVNDIMMVPLRDLSAALGFTVQWDADRQIVHLVPNTLPALVVPATVPTTTAPATP